MSADKAGSRSLQMDNIFYVYILKSESANKSYVGHTNNLERRLAEHNSGKSQFTRTYKPWRVIYSGKFETRLEAIEREKYFKSSSGRIFIKSILN
jgi:putative endonuclease